MHVFITGVAGFLGSNLADSLLKKGYKVSGCDSLVGGELENVNPKVKFSRVECENLEKMTNIMKGVQIVVHAAAYAHEGLSNFSPKSIVSNNIVGSTSVFTAAIKNKVKRIVYCSSMARYGKIKPPFEEQNKPIPVDPYGISKLAAEQILENLSSTFGFEYNIAVPHNIIGPKQKFDDPYRNVVSIMANMILQNKSPIIYGDGMQKRSFSDVDDCIFSIEKMMFDPKVKSQVINIGPDENYITINELYELISNKMQFNKPPVYVEDRPNEVKFSYCSAEKARKILKYKTSVTLDNSIQKTIDYIESKGPRKFKYDDYEIEIKNKLTPKTWIKKMF